MDLLLTYPTTSAAASAAEHTVPTAAESRVQQQHPATHRTQQQAAHLDHQGVRDDVLCDRGHTRDSSSDGGASNSISGNDSDSTSGDSVSSTANVGFAKKRACQPVAGYYSAEPHVLHTVAFPSRPGKPLCVFYVTKSHCKFGSACKNDHPGEYQVALTDEGLPFRPGQPLCVHHYLKSKCKYGPSCKFHHPKLPPEVATEAVRQQQQQQQGQMSAGSPQHQQHQQQPAALRVILGKVMNMGTAGASGSGPAAAPAAATAAAIPAVSAAGTAPAGAAAVLTPAGQVLVATMQAVTTATGVLQTLDQPLPVVSDKIHPYSNWQIVAEATAVQRLVKMYCPVVDILLDLSPEHTKAFCPLAIQQDVPETWQPDSPPKQLQSSMLLSYPGHMQAYSLLQPSCLRKRLNSVTQAAVSSGSGLSGWFWQVLAVFRDEWESPACCHPNEYVANAGTVLQQFVLSRVHLAHLRIEAYKLLCHSAALLPLELD